MLLLGLKNWNGIVNPDQGSIEDLQDTKNFSVPVNLGHYLTPLLKDVYLFVDLGKALKKGIFITF